MTKIRITYYGMEGEGSTVKEAKANAGRRLTAALGGEYTPHVFRLGKCAALVWREPRWGWLYALLPEKEGTPCAGYGGDLDFEGAQRAARYLLAGLNTELPEAELLAYVDREDRARLQASRNWQRAYRELRARGYSDVEAHAEASGLPTGR